MNRSFVLVATLAAVLTVVACREELKGGNACPSLCPEQSLVFKDTTFDAADVIDTALTLPGIPSIGTEVQMLVARYAQNGDSVVSVGVFRFDTLIRAIFPTDTTVTPIPISGVDSSWLSVYVLPAPSGEDTIFVPDTVTFIVHSVFVNAPDLDTAAVHAKFSGGIVGTLTVPRDSAYGALSINIDTAFVRQQLGAGNRIWLGIEIVCKKGAQLAFATTNGNLATGGTRGELWYHGKADTTTITVSNIVQAKATVYGPAIPALGDYEMIFAGSPPVPPGMLAVGGLPNNRTLILFKFPAWLVDSSTTVVRANLLLHQASFTGFRVDSDSVVMQPVLVAASPEVTDLSKVGILVGTPCIGSLRGDSLPPAGTGLDSIALVRATANTFTCWRARGKTMLRGIVLEQAPEGLDPRQLLFYPPSAAPGLRPQVHISYVPHSTIGLP